jgi:hypothetical protein
VVTPSTGGEPDGGRRRWLSYGLALLLACWIGASVWLTCWTGEWVRGAGLVALELASFGRPIIWLLSDPSLGSVRRAKRLLATALRSTGPGRRVRVLVARARLALVRRQRQRR